MRWFWGLVLLIIGVYFLGANAGLWSAQEGLKLLQFWPLLIVLFGLSLLVKDWKLGWLIILIAFAIAILFVYEVSFTASPVIKIDKLTKESLSTTRFSANLSANTAKATINIKSGATNLKIKDDSDKLVEGKMESNYAKPVLDVNTVNKETEVTLRTDRISGEWWRGKNNLDLSLTDRIPLVLNIDAGASSINADLSKVILQNLSINAGASSMDLKLGNQLLDGAVLDINSGASSINVVFPENIGVKITTKSSLLSKNFPNFKEITSNNYESGNYFDASKKVTINVSAGASSIKVSSY